MEMAVPKGKKHSTLLAAFGQGRNGRINEDNAISTDVHFGVA